jgi:CRISPR/Cas system-associated protein endoribonuclease Cas2
MTAMSDRLFTRLLKTRDSLADVCDELGIEMPDEGSLPCLQCSDCRQWRARGYFVLEAGAPVCSFCHDMYLLRF